MWVAESQYDILGTRFAVRSDDAEIAQRVEKLLFPFRIATIQPVRAKDLFALARTRPGDERHHAFRDCKRVGRSESWTRVLDSFLGEINRRAIDEMTYFGVHAGVMAVGARTIALPAASGAGKSTLVAACLQAGYQYVSDEALCMDYSTGLVVSYPKPLNLSQWSLEALGANTDPEPNADGSKVPIPPDQLGEIADTDRTLTDVVFTERTPGPPALTRLPPSDVMAGLLRYSFNHYKRPAEAFALVAAQARRANGLALQYEDPHTAASLLQSAFL